MAVSGNQLTRIGAYLFSIGKKLVITAKAEAATSLSVGILSAIDDIGNGSIGFRGALENGLLSAIVVESGMLSSITTDNESYSPINDEGNGLESLIS